MQNMSLLDQCSNLQKRVRQLEDVQKSAAEAEALSKRLTEAREIKTLVEQSVEKADLLISNSIEISASGIQSIDPLTPLGKIIQRFSENPEAASLVKFKDWNKFQELSQKWHHELSKAAVSSWKAFVDLKTQGQSPEKLKSALAQTETNKKALEKFSKIYREMQSLRVEFPENFDQVETVKKLSEQLKHASEEFDYNVHEEVKAFLTAIQQGGAPLELLTHEVLNWLRDNNSEHQFQIVGSHS